MIYGLLLVIVVFTFLGFAMYREIKVPLQKSKLKGEKGKEGRKELRRIKRDYLITAVVCSITFALIGVVFRGSPFLQNASRLIWGSG